eukprot:6981731-Alexandrium_andersonii.AAC.2
MGAPSTGVRRAQLGGSGAGPGAGRRSSRTSEQGCVIHNHEAAIAEHDNTLAGSCRALPLALRLLSKFLSLCLGVERERERERKTLRYPPHRGATVITKAVLKARGQQPEPTQGARQRAPRRRLQGPRFRPRCAGKQSLPNASRKASRWSWATQAALKPEWTRKSRARRRAWRSAWA